jgi:hypothetical protein
MGLKLLAYLPQALLDHNGREVRVRVAQLVVVELRRILVYEALRVFFFWQRILVYEALRGKSSGCAAGRC